MIYSYSSGIAESPYITHLRRIRKMMKFRKNIIISMNSNLKSFI